MRKKGVALIIVLIFLSIGVLAFTTYGSSPQVKEQLKLANKYLDEGNYQEAILAFEKVISLEPKNIEGRVGLAKAFVGVGKYEDAEKTLREAIDINPKKSESYLELANLYERQNKLDIAIAILQKGYEQTKDKRIKQRLDELNNRKQTLTQAEKLVNEGKYQEGIDLCAQILEDKQSAQALRITGLAYTYLKDYSRAIEYFNSALSIDPKLTKAYGGRAWAYNETKQHEKAIMDATKALELDPKYVPAYDYLAWANNSLKQYDKALDYANQGLAIDPNYYFLYNMRAWAYMDLGQMDKALEEVNKTLNLKADDPTGLALKKSIDSRKG